MLERICARITRIYTWKNLKQIVVDTVDIGGIHGVVGFKLMGGIYSCVFWLHIFLQISIFL